MLRNIIRKRIDFYLHASLNAPSEANRLSEAEKILLSKELSDLPGNISFLNEPILFGPASCIPAVVELPVSVKFVYYGYKQATLIHGEEYYVTQLLHYAESLGMLGILSPFEFDSYADDNLKGYSNIITQYRNARVGSGAWRGLLISYDCNILALAWIALTYNNHKALGYYLGYPACCVEKFNYNWEKAVKSDKGDLSIKALEDSGDIQHYWGTNIFTRYFGFEFIQHFPCSLSCKESIAIGKAYEQCLELYEPETLDKYKSVLKGTIVADKSNGVILIPETLLEQKGHHEFFISYSPDKILTSNTASPLFADAAGTTGFTYLKSSGTIKFSRNSYQGVLSEFI